MRAKGKQIGIVFFSSTQTGTYKSEHIQTYLEIADEISALVEHRQLRKAADSSFSQAQNLRMILHDLEAPLAVIQGFLDLTEDEDWYQGLDPNAKGVFSTLHWLVTRLAVSAINKRFIF